MLKRLLSLVLVVTLILGVTLTTFAASKDIDIFLDGKKILGQAYVN